MAPTQALKCKGQAGPVDFSAQRTPIQKVKLQGSEAGSNAGTARPLNELPTFSSRVEALALEELKSVSEALSIP